MAITVTIRRRYALEMASDLLPVDSRRFGRDGAQLSADDHLHAPEERNPATLHGNRDHGPFRGVHSRGLLSLAAVRPGRGAWNDPKRLLDGTRHRVAGSGDVDHSPAAGERRRSYGLGAGPLTQSSDSLRGSDACAGNSLSL